MSCTCIYCVLTFLPSLCKSQILYLTSPKMNYFVVLTKIFLKSCSFQFLKLYYYSGQRKEKYFYGIISTCRLFVSLNALSFIVPLLLMTALQEPGKGEVTRTEDRKLLCSRFCCSLTWHHETQLFARPGLLSYI